MPTLTWKLFTMCFVVSCASLWFTMWYSVRVYNRYYLQSTIDNVYKDAYLVNRQIAHYCNDSTGYRALDSLCKQIGAHITTRITIVLPSGKVIGDSKADPAKMDNHSNRPEIIQALAGKRKVEQRYSTTLHQNMLYVATPLYNNNVFCAVSRYAVSLETIRHQEHLFYVRVAVASLITLCLLAVVSFLIARQLIKPLRHMKNGAQKFANGELDFKLTIPQSQELGELALSLNLMAASLNERISIVTSQRNQLDAILASMEEGVIALDNNERVISINPSASRILALPNVSIEGKWLHEIVRNSNLQKFIADTLSHDNPHETAFVLSGIKGDRQIAACATVLKDRTLRPQGMVLVINDVTRLVQLENIRKEFVANVSHELRTPLTAIKGFVETILSGEYVLDTEVNRFLEIIAAKTERLSSIVDDLLTLASIERDIEHHEIERVSLSVKTVLDDAIKMCSSKAAQKNITLRCLCDTMLLAMVNAPLLEQAIVNLVDNAIKYSDAGKIVTVTAHQADTEIVLTVIDEGIGIPYEHQERIFERFYRVDKARSRKLGGTGLGLSIVKNIARAHFGYVTLESSPGNGSSFCIHLPVVSV